MDRAQLNSRSSAQSQRTPSHHTPLQSEAAMKAAQAIAQFGSFEYTLQSRKSVWSPELFRILGRPTRLGPLPPDRFGKFVHPEDRARVARSMMATMRHGRPFHEEFRVVCQDGSEKYVLSHAEVLLDESGKLHSIAGTLKDGTERWLSEEALKESKRRLSLIFDNVSDCIFVMDVADNDGYRFTSINDAFAKCTGLEREKLIGRTLDAVFPSTSLAQLKAKLRMAAATGRKVKWTQTIHYPLGARAAEFSIMPILDGSGNCVQLIGSTHDVTEIRRLTAATLRAAEEEQQRIGRDLHDGLGQEMTGIALYCGLLEDELKSKRLPEAASAAHLSGLINSVITQLSYISRGLQPVPDAPDGLRTGLRRLAAQVSALRGKTGVFHCRKTVEVRNPRAAVHLYRIAQEAVQNALRHGRPNCVGIRLGVRGGFIHLEVEDDGKGIRANWESATGIGFHTMKFRAESLGGTVSISPSSIGGTLVHCMVPAAAAGPATTPPHRERSRGHH